MKSVCFGSLAWVLSGAAFTCPARASSVVNLSEAGLIEHADTIVVGTVIANETVFLARPKTVMTRSQIQVQRGLRGAHEGDVVTVEVPGGTYHGIKYEVAGAPSFVPGNLIIGFFETHGSYKRPLGLSLGIYQVSLKAPGWVAQRDLSGLTLVGNGAPQPPLASPRLDDFLLRVATHLRHLGVGTP